MKRELDSLIRGLIAIDYLIPPVVFLLITFTGETPEGVRAVLGPGYLRIVAFFFIAAAIMMFYDEDLYISSKRLAFLGITIGALALIRAVEEAITAAYYNELSNLIIPPFYHTPRVFQLGRTLGSRSGTVFIILSSIIAFAIVYGDNFEYSRRLSLLLAHISVPAIIVLSGAIVAYPEFLAAHSMLFVEILKALIVLPVLSLIIIDVYLVLETTAIRE